MLTVREREDLFEKLRVYDVEQGAWEQELLGFEANATHVQLHLSRDLIADFDDPVTVKEVIAPGAVQHAMRLTRWAGLDPTAIYTTPLVESSTLDARRRIGIVPVYFAAFSEASGTLATHLHDLGHLSSHETATRNRPDVVHRVAQLLLYSADLQAEQHDFDLVEAFDASLAGLREQLGIPQPDSVTT